MGRRRHQQQFFAESGNRDEITFFDLRLLVTELIVEALNAESETNNAKVGLRAEFHDGRVRVEVAEGDGAFRLPSRRPEPGEAGWGLYLVGRLSSRWGLRRGPEGSSVWLEVSG